MQHRWGLRIYHNYKSAISPEPPGDPRGEKAVGEIACPP
jgi:hypothetical protein